MFWHSLLLGRRSVCFRVELSSVLVLCTDEFNCYTIAALVLKCHTFRCCLHFNFSSTMASSTATSAWRHQLWTSECFALLSLASVVSWLHQVLLKLMFLVQTWKHEITVVVCSWMLIRTVVVINRIKAFRLSFISCVYPLGMNSNLNVNMDMSSIKEPPQSRLRKWTTVDSISVNTSLEQNSSKHGMLKHIFK